MYSVLRRADWGSITPTWHARSSVRLSVYLLQHAEEKRASTVKISSRPSSIHAVSTARPKVFTAS